MALATAHFPFSFLLFPFSLGDLDACRRVAYENVEDALNAKIDYAELRFSPYYMAMKHNLPVQGVVEAAGPESMWQAIEELGATRIGHGVKALEDRSLMDYLAKHNIGIESCLTSNIQTSTVTSLASHPVKTFLEHGILATLNTDDPAVEGIELPHEYEVAAPQVGLSAEQIEQLQRNGLEIAFLSGGEKRELADIASKR